MASDDAGGRRSEAGGGGGISPVGSDTSPSRATVSPGAPQRPTNLLTRQSMSMSLPGVAFAREPSCGMCHKKFSILKRRHHCRSCHVAICKDCGHKAVVNGQFEQSIKPQWYCHPCIEDDDDIEVVGGGGRGTLTKRPSFSYAQPQSTLESVCA
jgi:hypothetical protein